MLTAAAHFGYGATMGALYAPLADKGSLSAAARGAGFGLAVWVGSYVGLLPALGLLKPATEHPARRNGLMITAHLIGARFSEFWSNAPAAVLVIDAGRRK